MNEFKATTVASVAADYLCCSCGACVAACPENAIYLKETPGGFLFPKISQELCTQCGKCLRVCPGITLRAELPDDPFAGRALGCWIGKAAECAVYEGSQSGGAVTAILLSLLSEGKIKGAIVVTMEPGAPPGPRVLIARTREEVLSAQGSKYCPVPVLASLRDLSGQSGPFAMVGLGCHVHGLYNLLDEVPELRQKVTPVIGLICERIMTYGAIDYLLSFSGIKEGCPVSLQYRSKEWQGYPGDVRIGIEGKRPFFLPGRERKKIKDFFTPPRCRLCFDKMNVLADIVAGDPVDIPSADNRNGESIVICRTPKGAETVKIAADSGQMDLREIPYNAALAGQAVEKKRVEFAGYCSAWRSMGRSLPAQSKTVLSNSSVYEKNRRFKRALRRALELDQSGSRQALTRRVRKRLTHREALRKIRRVFKR